MGWFSCDPIMLNTHKIIEKNEVKTIDGALVIAGLIIVIFLFVAAFVSSKIVFKYNKQLIIGEVMDNLQRRTPA